MFVDLSRIIDRELYGATQTVLNQVRDGGGVDAVQNEDGWSTSSLGSPWITTSPSGGDGSENGEAVDDLAGPGRPGTAETEYLSALDGLDYLDLDGRNMGVRDSPEQGSGYRNPFFYFATVGDMLGVTGFGDHEERLDTLGGVAGSGGQGGQGERGQEERDEFRNSEAQGQRGGRGQSRTADASAYPSKRWTILETPMRPVPPKKEGAARGGNKTGIDLLPDATSGSQQGPAPPSLSYLEELRLLSDSRLKPAPARSTNGAGLGPGSSWASNDHQTPQAADPLNPQRRPPLVMVAPLTTVSISPISPSQPTNDKSSRSSDNNRNTTTKPGPARAPSARRPGDDDNAPSQLTTITLVTDKLGELANFYDAAFGPASRAAADDVSAAYDFNGGALRVVLVDSHEAREKELLGRRGGGGGDERFMLSVRVDDADAARLRLRRLRVSGGAAVSGAPRETEPGRRAFFFRDPAGHAWEVWEKVGQR